MGCSDSMSAFTSTMALSWSGVSTYGKASSISFCHGVSGGKLCPVALTRIWYSTTSSWAISRTAERTRPLARSKSAPPRRCSAGRLAADVVAHGVDLVRRHVELVAALVLEQQVVAVDAADRALHHAAVAADAVVVVDDVVARAEVLEDAGGLAAAGPGRAVGAPAAGEVGLGEHGELDVGQHDAGVQRRHDDVAARSRQVDVAVGDERQLDAGVAQQLGQAGARAPCRRRPRRRGSPRRGDRPGGR